MTPAHGSGGITTVGIAAVAVIVSQSDSPSATTPAVVPPAEVMAPAVVPVPAPVRQPLPR